MKASAYVKPRKLLTDSQYSAANIRETPLKGGMLAYSLSKNQSKGVRAFLEFIGNFVVIAFKNSRERIGNMLLWSGISASSRIWQTSRSVI